MSKDPLSHVFGPDRRPPPAPPLPKPRKLLYVCAPYATRTAGEIVSTNDAILAALARGFAPVFLPYVYRDILTDSDPFQRSTALEACAALVTRCDDFLIVGDRMTDGMKRDLAAWEGRPTFNVTALLLRATS